MAGGFDSALLRPLVRLKSLRIDNADDEVLVSLPDLTPLDRLESLILPPESSGRVLLPQLAAQGPSPLVTIQLTSRYDYRASSMEDLIDAAGAEFDMMQKHIRPDIFPRLRTLRITLPRLYGPPTMLEIEASRARHIPDLEEQYEERFYNALHAGVQKELASRGVELLLGIAERRW